MSRLLLCALSFLALAPAAHAATLAELGGDDISVQGIDATATTFVRVPPGYAVDGGTVDLRYEHSSLLLPERSTVTLLVAGRPVGSARLTPSTAAGGRLQATLPPLPDAEGGFVLAARFHLRLTRDSCEDPRNAALWARMLDTTTVRPRIMPGRRSIATALADLAPPEIDRPIAMRLPADPSPAVLEAAGFAAAALGRADARVSADPLLSLVERARGGPELVIGTEGPKAGPGQGVLASRANGAPSLTVGGGDEEGLRLAAEALATRRLTEVTSGLETLDALPAPAPEEALPWRDGAASFAQLGIGQREVAGPGVSTVDLVVDRPPGWEVRDDAELELVVDAGAGLRDDTSSVTVSMAGHEIGSRRLEPGAGPVPLRFEIDGGLLDTDLDGRAVRSFPVSLRFDLDVEQEGCEPLEVDAARAVVLATSKLTLPHDEAGDDDLSRFPSPLGDDAEVDIVLPDDASEDELEAGLQVAAAYGRWAAPDAPLPRLVAAAQADGARDVILIGDGEKVAVPGGYEPRAGEGLLALTDSPFGDDRRALLVDGGDAAGLLVAAQALARGDSLRALVGRAMRVTGTDAAALTPGDGRPPLALAPVEEEGFWEELPPWAIPAAVILVLFLTLGFVFVRRRWGPGRAT